jgi:hypothetical protein
VRSLSDHLFYDERLDQWVCLDPRCLASLPPRYPRRRSQSVAMPSIDSQALEEGPGSNRAEADVSAERGSSDPRSLDLMPDPTTGHSTVEGTGDQPKPSQLEDQDASKSARAGSQIGVVGGTQ